MYEKTSDFRLSAFFLSFPSAFPMLMSLPFTLCFCQVSLREQVIALRADLHVQKTHHASSSSTTATATATAAAEVEASAAVSSAPTAAVQPPAPAPAAEPFHTPTKPSAPSSSSSSSSATATHGGNGNGGGLKRLLTIERGLLRLPTHQRQQQQQRAAGADESAENDRASDDALASSSASLASAFDSVRHETVTVNSNTAINTTNTTHQSHTITLAPAPLHASASSVVDNNAADSVLVEESMHETEVEKAVLQMIEARV
jgi:hypothetical protein